MIITVSYISTDMHLKKKKLYPGVRLQPLCSCFFSVYQPTQMKKNVNTSLEDRQQRIGGSQHEVLLISCIIGWVTTRQWEINEFKTESVYKIEIYQLNSQVFLKNREKDEEGALLIYDRGHLCKEKPQQGQDGEGLTPALIMGHFQMKSQSIRAGGHSNSPLCHSKTWNGNWSHGHVVGGGGACNLKQRTVNIHTNSCFWMRERVILDLTNDVLPQLKKMM